MKKMSDVFELPINHEYLEVYGPERAGIPYAEAEKHAAHAINHVDALAENLSTMVGMFERACEANSWDAERQPEYVAAKAALAAYRGEA